MTGQSTTAAARPLATKGGKMNITQFICGVFLFNARFMRNSDALALKVAALIIYVVAFRAPVLRVPPQHLAVRKMSIIETTDVARIWERAADNGQRVLEDEGMNTEARWLRVEDTEMSR
ncbi:hypothetical protein PFICI_08935 [Pestalotiopsis fici W106-1]|uniref:Uncharacterized protein n=1 Tax=Pestalotiopsis fici (strain W106-1 / CGMCC3.15140) TaxID=1229662 RepID=W3X108_PESFW|nr:uncharacterized protein PFICI_08935 [Pestalotiopsis fici W106-1]ETS79082.1 hypothetical protein PFICI_08935 [Pestalotiopsis fici W106-1]